MSFSKLVASSISLGIQLISFFTGTSRFCQLAYDGNVFLYTCSVLHQLFRTHLRLHILPWTSLIAKLQSFVLTWFSSSIPSVKQCILFNKSALVQNQFKLNSRKFRNRAQSRRLTNWYCRIYNSDVMIVIMLNLCLMEIFLVQMTARR